MVLIRVVTNREIARLDLCIGHKTVRCSMLNNLKKGKATLVGAVSVGASSGVLAAVDTTAAVAEVTSAGTAIGAVGGAILVLAGIALTYRWVKASFF